MRKLGKDQLGVLNELADARSSAAGRWNEQAGWRYGPTSRTVRILESLVKLGYVTKISADWTYPGEFEITQAGRDIEMQSRVEK